MAIKKVVQGAKANFDINLGIKDSTGIVRPFDLSGHTNPTPKVCWEAGGVKVEKELTSSDITILGDDTAGQINAVLTPTETLTFPAGTIGDVEVVVDKGSGNVTIFQQLQSWQVVEAICD